MIKAVLFDWNGVIIDDLEKFGIKDFFEFVISGEDIEKPKPHPEGLQKSIENFNI